MRAPLTATPGRRRQYDALALLDPPGLIRRPALDGLRGLAVAAVVAFHLRPTLVSGGNLGVSVFFTLSGFLISGVVAANIDRHGRFSAAEFWAARSRRILPVLLSVLVLVSIGRLSTDLFEGTGRVDALVSAGQVNNWYFLQREPDGRLFGSFSALLHLWSLSVEEQFYLVVAVGAGLAGAAGLGGPAARSTIDRLTMVRWVAASAALTSFLLPVAFRVDGPQIYVGTHTRAGKLLAGVWLCTMVARRRPGGHAATGRLWRAAASWGGLVALTAMVGLLVLADPFAVGNDDWILPTMAALSTLTIASVMVSDSPTAVLLGWAPLSWLGRISYCVYVVHVPISRVVNHWLDGWGEALVVVVATLLVAALSYRYFEMPIRNRRVAGRLLAAGAGCAIALIALTTLPR